MGIRTAGPHALLILILITIVYLFSRPPVLRAQYPSFKVAYYLHDPPGLFKDDSTVLPASNR